MSGVNSKHDIIPAVDTESQPDIFKLNAFCLSDWFDWLSQKELMRLRRTCKRFKQAVDYYIKNEAKFQTFVYRGLQVNDFNRDITKGGFEFINRLFITDRNFTESQIDENKQLFGQVEILEIYLPLRNCEFHDVMKYCTGLKYLSVFWDEVNLPNDWFRQHYPTLEHIEFYPCDLTGFQLGTFFELNPNIQTISCYFGDLFTLGSDIKIERLDIRYQGGDNLEEVVRVCNLLKDLYEHGSYKRLHVFFEDSLDVEEFQQITSLPALEYLYAYDLNIDADFTPLANVKELAVVKQLEVDKLEMMINSMTNIRRVYFSDSSINNILPFIQRCPQLRKINIQHLREGPYFEITIFIRENIFLANKWKQGINLSLIELRNAHLWKRSNPFFWN